MAATTLADLFPLAGTHDSGAYVIDAHRVSRAAATLPPLNVRWVRWALRDVLRDFSRTQRLTVYEQLVAGARFLDIRVSKLTPAAADERLWVVHGAAACVPLADIISQINAFHDQSQSRAHVILAVRHFRLSPAEVTALATQLNSQLAHPIFRGDADALAVTPLVDLAVNIVAGVAGVSKLGPGWAVDDWINTYCGERKIAGLHGQLSSAVRQAAAESSLSCAPAAAVDERLACVDALPPSPRVVSAPASSAAPSDAAVSAAATSANARATGMAADGSTPLPPPSTLTSAPSSTLTSAPSSAWSSLRGSPDNSPPPSRSPSRPRSPPPLVFAPASPSLPTGPRKSAASSLPSACGGTPPRSLSLGAPPSLSNPPSDPPLSIRDDGRVGAPRLAADAAARPAPSRRLDALFVLGWTVTPHATDIAMRIVSVGRVRPSLITEASRFNARLAPFLADHAPTVAAVVDVLFFDFFSPAIAAAIGRVREERAASAAAAAAATMTTATTTTTATVGDSGAATADVSKHTDEAPVPLASSWLHGASSVLRAVVPSPRVPGAGWGRRLWGRIRWR
ncbi:hypothetical protein MMPV_004885 [Pyropia vietnamensis]